MSSLTSFLPVALVSSGIFALCASLQSLPLQTTGFAPFTLGHVSHVFSVAGHVAYGT